MAESARDQFVMQIYQTQIHGCSKGALHLLKVLTCSQPTIRTIMINKMPFVALEVTGVGHGLMINSCVPSGPEPPLMHVRHVTGPVHSRGLLDYTITFLIEIYFQITFW